MAHDYVVQDPPRSPLLFQYGESFAQFIDGFAPAAPIPYLADVARLEYLRGLAYHAADAEPLPAAAFAALDGGRLAAFKVRLHPSVFVLASDYPVVTIWEANRGGYGRADQSARERGCADREALHRGRDETARAWDRRFPCEPQEQIHDR